MAKSRREPNIVITGTPGVGKTTHAERLAEATGLGHLCLNKVAEENDCHDGRDEELQSWIVDEDKLLDAIEPACLAGGQILDWHACDLFPASWIDLVLVVRCDSTVLFDRLSARVPKYPQKKLDENMDAEIMQVLLDEAREAYDEEIVVELRSDTVEELEANVERIVLWVEKWKADRGGREYGGDDEDDED